MLSVMERELASGEQEVRGLREEVLALNAQAQAQEGRHRAEVQQLSRQLEKAHSSIVSWRTKRASSLFFSFFVFLNLWCYIWPCMKCDFAVYLSTL